MAKQIAHKADWKQGKEEDFMAYLKRMDDVLDKISAEGNLLRFSAADSYAYYEVVSRNPLTIRHIPAGDAWGISPAHIRGLRLQDIDKR
jgi:hypothetical protein